MNKIKSLFGAQDMTVGNPTVALLKFAIPLLIGNIFQQLYNTVDSIVVGKVIGDTALASVGAAGPILNLLLALFGGVATGAGIIVAQYFGAKNREGLSKAVGNVLFLTCVITAIIMAVGSVFSKPLLQLMKTPTEGGVLDGANAYLVIFFLGFIGFGIYNMGSGMLRGMGDSVMPLIYLIFCCILNIVLDIVLINIMKTVAAVAIATVIAQMVSSVLVLMRLKKMKDVLDFGVKYMKPDGRLCRNVIMMGLPAGLTQAIFSCSALVVQSLINTFGQTVMATNTVIMRVDAFAMMPNFSFGMAMTTYIGQNVGAKEHERVRSAWKHGMKISLIIVSVMVALICIFCDTLMGIFTKTPEVVALGSSMLRMLGIGYLFCTVMQIFQGIMRGAGDTMSPMLISILSTVIIRIPLAYMMNSWFEGKVFTVMGQNLGDNSQSLCIFLSMLISWFCGAVITALFFRFGNWRKKALQSVAAENDN
ncbi:MAG: MATE family efflux transporter [Clostridia bacterium]|nr:MATE family efflux transporter [Clostridia bacterium]